MDANPIHVDKEGRWSHEVRSFKIKGMEGHRLIAWALFHPCEQTSVCVERRVAYVDGGGVCTYPPHLYKRMGGKNMSIVLFPSVGRCG
jgi:hypothetical protein